MIKRKPIPATELDRSHTRVNEFRRTTPAGSTMDREAIADYLADMILQLEQIARSTNKDMLAYLLSMASIQAVAPEARWEGSKALH